MIKALKFSLRDSANQSMVNIPEHLKPENFKVTEWIAILTVIGATLATFWKKILKPFCRSITNWIKLAGNVVKIIEKQIAIEESIVALKCRSYAILDAHHHPILEFDKNGKCIFVNSYTTTLLGVQAETMYKDGWKSIINKNDRENFVEEWELSISENRDFKMPCNLESSQGELIKVLSIARRITNNSQTIGYICHIKIL
jgi:PAS domain S-box-containing protein